MSSCPYIAFMSLCLGAHAPVPPLGRPTYPPCVPCTARPAGLRWPAEPRRTGTHRAAAARTHSGRVTLTALTAPATARPPAQAKLIAALGLAIENEGEDEFTRVVKEYDTVSKLDDWMTMILLRIKKGMTDLT